MVACFFRKTSYVSRALLQNHRTVNSEWYSTICLVEVFGEIRRIILHQDNANYHTSCLTTDYLSSQKIESMGYSPYNPDLASSFVNRTLKINCMDNDFHRHKKALMYSKIMFWRRFRLNWTKCLDKWFEGIQKYIDHKREYFEKQQCCFK